MIPFDVIIVDSFENIDFILIDNEKIDIVIEPYIDFIIDIHFLGDEYDIFSKYRNPKDNVRAYCPPYITTENICDIITEDGCNLVYKYGDDPI